MILIDKEIVSVEEYKERVMIVREDIYDMGFRDKDYRLFEFLGVEPVDEFGDEMPIEDFVDEIGEAFFDFLDFVGYRDCERCGNIGKCDDLDMCADKFESLRVLF